MEVDDIRLGSSVMGVIRVLSQQLTQWLQLVCATYSIWKLIAYIGQISQV